MIKYISILFILLSFQSIAQSHKATDSTATILIIKGSYSGQNIYIQNPLENYVKGAFCTDSVLLNGKQQQVLLNNSAYEIDLSQLKMETPFKIIIYHKTFCDIKMLGRYTWPPFKSKIAFTTFDINTQGCIHITATNHPEGLRPNLKLEQLRGGMWRFVGYIPQKNELINSYDTIVGLSGGLNTYRISEAIWPFEMKEATVFSPIKSITYKIDATYNNIAFSDSAYYSVYNSEDIQLFKGYNKTVDISYMKDGSYILLYENERILFDIKRRK